MILVNTFELRSCHEAYHHHFFLTSFAVLTAGRSDALQELDVDKDEVKSEVKKQPIDSCGEDLKALQSWVKEMNAQLNKGKFPDMAKGQALTKKFRPLSLKNPSLLNAIQSMVACKSPCQRRRQTKQNHLIGVMLNVTR